MNWEAISAIGEIIGAVAVVATLGYLAVQIKQNAASLQSTTELDASRQLANFVARISADKEIQRIWDEALSGDELSDGDFRQFVWLMAEFFHMAEGIFIQFQKGLLSKTVWEEFERLITSCLALTPAQAWWRSGKAPFSDGFIVHVNVLLDQPNSWGLVPVAGEGGMRSQRDEQVKQD